MLRDQRAGLNRRAARIAAAGRQVEPAAVHLGEAARAGQRIVQGQGAARCSADGARGVQRDGARMGGRAGALQRAALLHAAAVEGQPAGGQRHAVDQQRRPVVDEHPAAAERTGVLRDQRTGSDRGATAKAGAVAKAQRAEALLDHAHRHPAGKRSTERQVATVRHPQDNRPRIVEGDRAVVARGARPRERTAATHPAPRQLKGRDAEVHGVDVERSAVRHLHPATAQYIAAAAHRKGAGLDPGHAEIIRAGAGQVQRCVAGLGEHARGAAADGAGIGVLETLIHRQLARGAQEHPRRRIAPAQVCDALGGVGDIQGRAGPHQGLGVRQHAIARGPERTRQDLGVEQAAGSIEDQDAAADLLQDRCGARRDVRTAVDLAAERERVRRPGRLHPGVADHRDRAAVGRRAAAREGLEAREAAGEGK